MSSVTGSGPLSADPLDSDTETVRRQVEHWRGMSPAEKLSIVDALNEDVQRLAEAGVRLRHPHSTPRDVFLRVAALRNGRALTLAAYGWDADQEGW